MTELERVLTEMMAERIGVPSPVLAATVYNEQYPPDPVQDLHNLLDRDAPAGPEE